jgi:hypothetical protein
MRQTVLAITVSALLCLAGTAVAQEPDALDEVVRLPGQGQVKADAYPGRRAHTRLVPGGGLIMSFDADGDGRVTPAELQEGAIRAFAAADTNAEGSLSALEQQAWAKSLPTHDDTLANPVRFDPNLDRVVDKSEFLDVIAQLAAAYTDAATGDVLISSLDAPERDRDRPEQRELSDLGRTGGLERR